MIKIYTLNDYNLNRDDKMLREIMGDYPQVKVIEILITHPWSEYTKKDLAEASGISRRTLYNLLNKLETFQIIKPTRKIGSAQLYTLNQESKTTRAIMAFQKELVEIEITKQLKDEDQIVGESPILTGKQPEKRRVH
jgi:Fe2+ or Zn2+ uptake regulation protein